MAHEVETMFSLRETPWHGLGQVVKEALTLREALQISGLDWEVQKQPIFTGDALIDSHRATVRVSDQKILGVVGKDYEVFQNWEAFDFLDALKGEGAIQWETAGSLREGKRVWITCSMGDDLVLPKGDTIKPYITFANGHDGTLAMTVMRSPVRVVCMNTLRMAFKDNQATFSNKHTRNMRDRLVFAQKALGLVAEGFKTLQVTASYLAGEELTDKKLHQFLDSFMPLPEEDGRGKTRMNNNRDSLLGLLDAPTNTDPDSKGTLWGLFGAASEWVQHESTRHAGTENWDRMLFGSGVDHVQRAWDSVMALV